MRFHLLGLVHLPVSERYVACAFTQKIVKMSRMLLDLGHEVYLYGSEGSDAPCTEFIQTHTLQDIRKAWGSGDNRFEVGYNYEKEGFRHDFNTERTDATKKYYGNVILEISKRKREDDFLLIPQGKYQSTIYNALNMYLTCEFGVGYRGSDPKNFRAFESSYLQNFTYGSEHPFESINGNYYDRVIPNYFDEKDFHLEFNKKDYYLYIGRVILRKGVWTAIKATQAIGARLIIAGQEDSEIDVKNLPDHCEFVGYADVKKREKLMQHAYATFVPSVYLEAFGGVHIESMLCGTPVITTNFGVFPETVVDGENGYRCNTLQDFIIAANKAPRIPKSLIRLRGERFLMKNVQHEYQRWFSDLYQLYLSSKDSNIKGWHHVE